MSHQYKQSPRFSATRLATGPILAVIVAMGISLLVDQRPVDAAASATAAHTFSTHA